MTTVGREWRHHGTLASAVRQDLGRVFWGWKRRGRGERGERKRRGEKDERRWERRELVTFSIGIHREKHGRQEKRLRKWGKVVREWKCVRKQVDSFSLLLKLFFKETRLEERSVKGNVFVSVTMCCSRKRLRTNKHTKKIMRFSNTTDQTDTIFSLYKQTCTGRQF